MPCGHCDRWQRKYNCQKKTADIHRRERKAAERALENVKTGVRESLILGGMPEVTANTLLARWEQGLKI